MDKSLLHQMREQEGQHLSAASRVKRIQERMDAEADAVKRAAKANEVETKSRRRPKRDRDFWVNGLVVGTPTEMAYPVTQAITHLTAYFHPDPDNPPTVKGFVADIETIDKTPVHCRARKFADIEKALTRKLIKQGVLEVSTGEYSSGLVLVPFHDRIKKFMDK